MTTISFKLDDLNQKESTIDKLSSLQGVFKVVCDNEGGFVKTDVNTVPERVIEKMQDIDGISDVVMHFRYDK